VIVGVAYSPMWTNHHSLGVLSTNQGRVTLNRPNLTTNVTTLACYILVIRQAMFIIFGSNVAKKKKKYKAVKSYFLCFWGHTKVNKHMIYSYFVFLLVAFASVCVNIISRYTTVHR